MLFLCLISKTVLTNQYNNVAPEIVLQPSPLLGETPEFVRLNFEVGPGQSLTSPQVPTGNQRDLVEASGIDPTVLARASADLSRLRDLLNTPVPSTAGTPARTNMDRFYLASEPETATWNAVRIEEVEVKAAAVQEQRRQDSPTRSRSTKEYRDDFAYVEKGKRAQVIEQALNKAAQSSLKQSVTPEVSGTPAMTRLFQARHS